MLRAPCVPLVLAVSLVGAALLATASFAQTDLKPRPGSTPPAPGPTHSQGRGAVDRERVTMRVAVGERAPDFELDLIDGTPMRLSKMRGDWLMLFFVERRESLDVITPTARALKETGVKTMVVCFDKAYVLGRYVAKRDLGFTPLPDPTGDIIALYGLMDDDTPRPGFVLINPRGEVRLALLGGSGLPLAEASRLAELAIRGE